MTSIFPVAESYKKQIPFDIYYEMNQDNVELVRTIVCQDG